MHNRRIVLNTKSIIYNLNETNFELKKDVLVFFDFNFIKWI
jgi:hypothetical protein